MERITRKKAMSSFEVIGYAILTLVVVIVCIVIFTKLAKGPNDTVGKIGTSTSDSLEACKKDPANCNPLGKLDAPLVEHVDHNDNYDFGRNVNNA